MNEPSQREEQAILTLLESLEQGAGEASAPPAGAEGPDAEADRTLERLYAEALGLLPFALAAEPPRPEVKQRLMARIAGEWAASGSAARPSAVVAIEERRQRSAERTAVADGAAGAPSPRASKRSWWTAVAALFAAAALALAGWLYLELDRTQSTLATVEHARGALAETLATQEALLADRGQMGDLISLISTPGVEACSLRPVGEDPMAPEAHAILYLAPGDRDWYLVTSDLDLPQAGVFKVWFYTPQGAVAAGVIDEHHQGRLRISAYRLSIEGMQAVAVTLEPSADSPAPTGPMVLYGDERMAIL